jgi:hypothetical protein
MRRLGALAALLLWAPLVFADGGTMLLHQDAGAFTVSLFAAPQPLHSGAADLSVMVQDRASGEVLLDPTIDITVGPQQAVRLTRGEASNRLLQAATVHFSNPGTWRLAVVVHWGKDSAQVSTECTVEPDHSRAALVWIYVLFAVGITLLFIAHQALKLRSPPPNHTRS